MVQLSYSWLAIVVDASVKSLLLAALCGLALLVLRVRDTNARHRAWTAVLVGMLAMPLLVLITPAVPLPGWMSIAWQPVPLTDEAEEHAAAEPVAVPVPSEAPEPTADLAGDLDRGAEAAPYAIAEDFPPDPFESAQHIGASTPIGEAPAEHVASQQLTTLPTEVAAASTQQDSAPPRLAVYWPAVLLAVYAFGLLALLFRFLMGLWLMVRLVRQSRPVDPYATAPTAGRRARLLEHPQVYVPLTVGFLRPAILLPADWREWSPEKLHAVLAHEMAHVRRADWLVALLSELNRALYWFHPLAWFLRARLSALAEQNCDDAVLEANGDRAQYARYLLEVASSLAASGGRCRAPLQSIAMARIPSVETRINAILDSGRPLARKFGAIGVALLLAVGIPAILLAAALQPGSKDVASPESVEEEAAVTAEANETDEANDTADEDDGMRRVQGRVLGPDGDPVAGAEVSVVAVHMGGAPGYPQYAHRILATTQSDAEGRFELEFSPDYPDKSELESQFVLEYPDWRPSSAGWQVVAHAEGLGTGWLHSHAFKEQDAPALELSEDAPIEGRIVDLEGQPLTGVSVRLRELHASPGEGAIGEWIQEAREKPQPPTLRDYFSRSDSRYPSAFPRVALDGGIAMGSPALPAKVTTDDEGRFQFAGVGADRLAILEVEAPTITKSLLHVVTREMEPVSARKLIAIGVHSPVHYGRKFEYVAQPSQPIEGHVTDAESGEPLAGMFVQVQMFAENAFGQDGFLTARTDAEGRYRLEGAPQGGGHHIEVLPTIDQPYFPTDREAERGAGFEPITCNFELRRGLWIRGKLMETGTDTPIVGATVQYLPLRSNKYAEQYPNYDPQISGSVPSDRYRTAEDGSFRVLAIPGDGIVTAIAQQEDRHVYYTLGTEGVPDHLLEGDRRDYLKTYHPWTASGFHALREVQLPESADEVAYDLHITCGLTRRVEIVDESGRPVTGTRVLGRIFPASHLEQPLEDSSLEVIGLRPDDRRIVALIHPDKQIGKSLVLSPRGEEMTIALERCAVVRGRVVDADAEPVQDVEVQVTIDSREVKDNWHRALTGATTDEDGRFEVLLPPGLTYRVWHYSRPPGPNFSATCQPNPGDVIDLGDVTEGTELESDDTAAMTTAREVANRTRGVAQGKSELVVSNRTAAARDEQTPFIYEGQVLTPNGQPAAGADLHLVYWYSFPDSSARHNPVAQTDEDGQFRFEMSRDDFHRTGDSVPPWQWASLVAVADGHGMAWATSVAFEKTGAVFQEMTDPRHPSGRDEDRLREMIERHQGRLRLVRDDVPVRGQIVDTEGQPVPGARIRFLEAYQGQDGTLDAWLEAAGKPRADFYSVRQTVPSHLYGPLAQKLLPPVETDRNGEFTIQGIGRERVVRLLVEAPHSEWADIYCRTRPGATIEIGSGMPERNMAVHGPAFNHVAAPSKPVTGVIRDKVTGEPIAGVTVKSEQSWLHTAPRKSIRGGNDFSHAVTDENGKFELHGLPKSQRNPVHFITSSDMGLLPLIRDVDTRGTDVRPVELAIELDRGVVVTGRIIDAETGEGVSGRILYLAAEEELPSAASVSSNSTWIMATGEPFRTDMQGNFQLVVPPKTRALAFRAYDDTYHQSVRGSSMITGSAGGKLLVTGGTYHATAKLDLSSDSQVQFVEMQVSRGRIITGTAVDPDGRPLDGGQYVGRTEDGGRYPLNAGTFAVTNYDPAQPRRVTFVHWGKQLAGTQVLKGEIDENLRVRLQPWGTATGRVVDERDEPIADLRITSGNMAQIMPAMARPHDSTEEQLVVPLPPADDYGSSRIQTDENGRFTIEGLVPGEEYSFFGSQQTGPFETRQTGDIASNVVVQPGQTLDLGDLRLQPPDLEALRRKADKRTEEAGKVRVLQDKADNAPASSSEVKHRTDGDAPLQNSHDAAGRTDAARDANTATVQREEGEERRTIRVIGKVVEPDGEPLESARLYWPRTRTPEPMSLDDMYLQQVATSARDGSFSAELVFPSLSWRRKVPLLAIADGFGLAWVNVSLEQTSEELTLQMAEEFPISGRVLTTEGTPVPGAAVGLHAVMTDSSGGIDKLLTAWKSEWRSSSMKVDKVLHIGLHLVGEVLGNELTDQQGKFTIRGLGQEHAVWINVSSPSIARSSAIVITRKGFEPDLYNQAALAQAGSMELRRRQTPKLYSNNLTIVAEPGKVITGKVTDIESGEPLEGVRVDTSGGYGDAIMATTDADGKYRLAGIPLHDDDVLISFRKPHTRYLPRTLATRLTPGLAAMEFDAGLAKGVVLKGRVTETETGKPVAGGIRFAPLEDNPWKDKPGYDRYKRSRVMENVDRNGNFEFVSIPGPGVLLMQAGPSGVEIGGQYVKPYRKGRFSKEDRDKVRIYVEGESFYTSSNGLEFFENGMKVLDIPEDVEQYTANVTVDRGIDVDVAMVDEEGQPLTGAMVCGVTESWPITYSTPESSIRIYALDPDDPRNVIFYHRERQLACKLTIRGDEKEPVVAKLQPTNTLVGRAVDVDGEPLAGAEVNVSWSDDTSREFQRQLDMTREPVTTDEDGRFRIEGAMPGVFRLSFSLGDQRYRTEKKWDEFRAIASALIPVGGSEIALGEITAKPR